MQLVKLTDEQSLGLSPMTAMCLPASFRSTVVTDRNRCKAAQKVSTDVASKRAAQDQWSVAPDRLQRICIAWHKRGTCRAQNTATQTHGPLVSLWRVPLNNSYGEG